LSPLLGPDWTSYGPLYVARLSGVAAGALLAIFSARALHPQGRGEFATIVTAIVLAIQVLNLGLSSSLLVLFSRRPHRVARYRACLWYLAAFWALLLVLLGAGLREVAPAAHPILRWWPFCAAWIPLQLLGLHQAAGMLALQAARPLALIEVSGRILAALLGGLSLMIFPASLNWFVAALIAADAVVAALGARFLLRVPSGGRRSTRRPAAFVKAAFKLGLRAHPLLFLPYLLIKSDILLVRVLRGAEETGIYSIASQIVDIALILPVTIGAVAAPSIVRSSAPREALARFLRPALVLTLATAFLLLVFGHLGTVVLFGRAYAGAYAALLFLLPGFVCLALQSLIAQYFAARGFPPAMSLYWLLGLVLNLALNFAFIPRFGFLAAALSSSLAYALVFALMARRFLKEDRPAAHV
jgi:O-antigen/teichoic acid export membrane protein